MAPPKNSDGPAVSPDVGEAPDVQKQGDPRLALTLEGNPPIGQNDGPPSQASSITSHESVTGKGFPPSTVGDTSFTFGAQIPENQNAALEDRRAINLDLARASGVANPDQFVNEAFNAADRLMNTPAAEREKAFQEIMANALKNHPEALPGTFGRVLNDALKNEPGSKLSTIFNGTVLMLADQNAATPENQNGIVASAFQGYGADTLQRDQAAFNAGLSIAKIEDQARAGIPPDQVARFDASLNEIADQMKSAGLFERQPDIGARKPPEGADTTAQLASLKAAFPNVSDQLAADLLKAGRSIAFADPSEMQAKFTQALDQLSATNPDLRTAGAVEMLAKSMNVVTDSNDFSMSGSGGSMQMNWVRDKRLSTPDNPNGNFGFAVTPDQAVDRTAFDTVARMADTTRRAAASFDPAQKSGSFTNDVFQLRRFAD